jgi:CBS domain-containing protein
MSSPVISVERSAELAVAAGLMRRDRIGSLVVDAGRVVGIVTETDLLRRIVQVNAAADVSEIIVSYP